MKNRICVRVLPRASKQCVVGTMEDGTLKVKLMAAPVGGAANKALCKLLASQYNVPVRAIVIVRGETSTHKVVDVDYGAS